MPDLVFLTRPGCGNTRVMQERLDTALRRMDSKRTYQMLDLSTLGASDARRSYPTPTLLVGGSDLFGMPQPSEGQAPT